MRWSMVLLGSSILLTSVAAQPQTGKASGAEKSARTTPVTLAASSQTLEDFLSRLNSPGRPHLQVAQDARWERVTVFTHDLPLSKVLSGLSTLLDYTWDREKGAKPPGRETLIPDIHARDYEARLQEETPERAAGPLFQLTGYLRTPAEEFKRQEKELEAEHKEPDDPLLRNGNLYYLGKQDSRNALELLATLAPKQRSALLTDARYLLPWDAMNVHQRELAQALALSIGKDRQNSAELGVPPFRPGEKAEDSVTWLQQFGLALYVSKHPVTGAVTTYGYGLGGATYSGVGLDGSGIASDLLPVRGNPYLRTSADRLPSYPDLERMPFPAQFTLEPGKNVLWAQVLEQLSKTVSLPLFSDDFTVWPTPEERGGTDLPKLTRLNLEEGLDALCNRYHRLWWYADGTLFFRSRTWFIERQYEVPPPVLAMLRKQLAAHGRLDTQALTQLSQLTRQQLEGLNATTAIDKGGLKLNAEAFRRLRGEDSAGAAYEYLQIYARLDETQKQQVLSADGLPLAQMTPGQQRMFLQTMFLEVWSEMEQPPQDVQFWIKQTKLSGYGTPLPQKPQTPVVVNVGFEGMKLSGRNFFFGGLRISYQPEEPAANP